MPAIDYEAEYDNRARVPEHPAILARWTDDAARYRAASPHAQLGLAYGPSPRCTIDLFPAQTDDAIAPLALFIHGGYWRSLEPSMFSHMAAGPNAHGISVAVVGYDLCPQVAIADIIGQIRSACLLLWRSHRKRIFVYGHSAGGHLTACMVATDFGKLDASAPSDLVPAGYAISGVFDLAPLLRVSQNADLQLTPETARAASPVFWTLPPGRRFDAVAGGKESAEFLRQSKIIVEAWKPAAIEARYEEISGANHFTVVDPLADPRSAMTGHVAEMAMEMHAASV
jgi:arylformamidase